jgi:hypothetical protein
MLSLAHTLISLPWGVYLDNPMLVFVIAAALHFAADMLPHWNIYPQNFSRFPYELIALDIVAGLGIAFVLLGNDLLTLPILVAIAGGNAPDIAQCLWLLAGGEKEPRRFPAWFNVPFLFHHRIQFELASPLKGLISQIIGAAIAIVLIT